MTEDLSMSEVFLNRLRGIVEANLENEQFGVKELAQEIGMSRSQIHRKLKALTKQSVSQFIREVRLRKAMELLLQDAGTASEISYRVGFGSPTYFTKCFHDFYGFPPGEVRKAKTGSLLQQKEPVSFKPTPENEKVFQFSKLWFLLIGFLLIVGVASYLVPMMKGGENYKIASNKILDKSIAVLPFKNLSEDQGNQYFADGVMEDILNCLSSIHDLKVISRVSSDHYRGSLTGLPQIAKELSVSYVLEGSVQRYEDEVRIFVQLIEAQNDQHIWAKAFDCTFENILAVQSDIAKQVASELEMVLTPEEKKLVERKQTENLDAYNLYLQGRYFWNKRIEKDVKTSLKYFEQCVARDSSYALAYAGLADAYFILAVWGWYPREEGYAKSKELAQKALRLDQHLAEPYATLGSIALYNWNWAEAEKKLKRAIELNENYATAHQWYAEYLASQGNIHGAIHEINKAVELDPLSIVIHRVSGVYHFHAGEYEKALNLFQTVVEMDPNQREVHFDIFLNYLYTGMNEEAVEELKIFFSMKSSVKKHVERVKGLFDDAGIQAVISWFVDWQIEKPKRNPYLIAILFAKGGQKEKALDWLENTVIAKSDFVHRIKVDCYLKDLRSEPRYKTLLKKVGLEE